MLPKIAHPVFDVTIPTTKKRIKIRPMVVKEEKILLTAKQSGEYSDILTSMQQVLNNCIVNESMDVSKLPLIDLEYLFLKLRANSISNILSVVYKDNEDQKPYTFEVDLEKVEIKYPPSVSNIVQIDDKIFFTLKYPTVDFFIDLPYFDINDDVHFNKLLLTCIDKIYEENKEHDISSVSKEDLQTFIDSIPAKHFEQIKKYFTSLPHLYYEINYKNAVGHDRKIKMEKLQDFF